MSAEDMLESSMENSENAREGNFAYNHTDAISQIEDINKQLNELKTSLCKSIVKCHLLEVDLASQFNPHMIQTLRQTEKDCSHCSKKLEFHFSNSVITN
ncbi:hypothetical protein SNE40_007950 [Patella caerulea]|uniref:Uncharacterized protein n=1 Tax=Patella caerulea TaxID=87958 RepID=A0AAN8JYZ8_PATCE